MCSFKTIRVPQINLNYNYSLVRIYAGKNIQVNLVQTAMNISYFLIFFFFFYAQLSILKNWWLRSNKWTFFIQTGYGPKNMSLKRILQNSIIIITISRRQETSITNFSVKNIRPRSKCSKWQLNSSELDSCDLIVTGSVILNIGLIILKSYCHLASFIIIHSPILTLDFL